MLRSFILHVPFATSQPGFTRFRHPMEEEISPLLSGGNSTQPLSLRCPRPTACSCLLEPICPTLPESPDPNLTNEDLAPITRDSRILSAQDMTNLWLGLVVSVPNYYLAGSLVELGMSWSQGIQTVVIANVVTWFVLVLSGQPGTKYGLPFPVILRASFGVYGANIPALLRGLVACGWYGIETWIGGQAIFRLLDIVFKRKLGALAVHLPFLGTSLPELACFAVFWALQIWIVWNGMESVKKLETYSAPVLIVLTVALLVWAYLSAGGFGPLLSKQSEFRPGGTKEGMFWQVFLPSLTANVGTWSTLSLNIPDFTRYAYSQSDQVIGQACLPLFMGIFSFIGLAVTSATEVIYGMPISNPIDLLAKMNAGPLPALVSLLGITLATVTTNIAANVVAPANAIMNIDPRRFTYKTAVLLVAVVSVCFLPWKLLQTSHGFIYTWLVGYSALLGPIGGIVLADYYVVRKRILDIDALYSSKEDGKYWYFKGVNIAAILALTAGILPCVPGLLNAAGVIHKVPNVFVVVYDGAWFAGFFIAAILYVVLNKRGKLI